MPINRSQIGFCKLRKVMQQAGSVLAVFPLYIAIARTGQTDYFGTKRVMPHIVNHLYPERR